jgi:hypothetical protein
MEPNFQFLSGASKTTASKQGFAKVNPQRDHRETTANPVKWMRMKSPPHRTADKTQLRMTEVSNSGQSKNPRKVNQIQ